MTIDPKRLVALVGAVMVVLGSFLDWATVDSAFGSLGVGGMEGDGKLTLVAGLVAGVLLLLVRGRAGGIVGAVLLAIAALIGFVDYGNVQEMVDAVESEFARASVGVGLYLVIAGGILGVVGSVLSLKSGRPPTVPPHPMSPLPPPTLPQA